MDFRASRERSLETNLRPRCCVRTGVVLRLPGITSKDIRGGAVPVRAPLRRGVRPQDAGAGGDGAWRCVPQRPPHGPLLIFQYAPPPPSGFSSAAKLWPQVRHGSCKGFVGIRRLRFRVVDAFNLPFRCLPLPPAVLQRRPFSAGCHRGRMALWNAGRRQPWSRSTACEIRKMELVKAQMASGCAPPACPATFPFLPCIPCAFRHRPDGPRLQPAAHRKRGVAIW